MSPLFSLAKASSGGGAGKKKETKSVPSAKVLTDSGLLAWRKRINRIQSNVVTPEIRNRILAQQALSQRRRKGKKKAKGIKRSMRSANRCYNQMQSRVQKLSMQQRQAPSSANEYNNNLSLLMESNMCAMRDVQECIQSTRGGEEEEECMSEVVALMDVEDEMDEAVELAEESKDINDFDKMIESIRNEPTEEEETKVQFQIYEEYLKTVISALEAVFELWETSQNDFPENAKNQMNSKIKRIDSAANMHISFDSRNWFVYEMMIKAEQNRRKIVSLIKEIETKLELMSREDEDCPICLEKMKKDTRTILSCCHCVCTECWVHWSTIMAGNRAFCPICRNEEFLSNVLVPVE